MKGGDCEIDSFPASSKRGKKGSSDAGTRQIVVVAAAAAASAAAATAAAAYMSWSICPHDVDLVNAHERLSLKHFHTIH